MIPVPNGTKIFLRPGKTDGRQGINTLAMLAEGTMKENPFSGNLFLFLNKRGTTIKGLYWDKNGFCLWMKRLEEERFHWPASDQEMGAKEISIKELQWILDGLNLAKLKPHKIRNYSTIL
ncbi:IS66 family insertion sequence element accessory protein TnpB [Treponema sp.]|jgi:transposase